MTSSFQSTAFQSSARPVDTFVAEPSVLPKTDLMELAETFATIFRNKTIGIVKLFEANFERITDESHFGVNVLIPFWWDRT